MASEHRVARYCRRFSSSGTIPSASISEYILKVVSGVRSSCVTAETNAPRRSLSETAPLSSAATARPASKTHDHATASEKRIGDQNGRGSISTWPVIRCAGRAARRRVSLFSPATNAMRCKSPAGNKSLTLAMSEARNLSQSSQHPWISTWLFSTTRRARMSAESSQAALKGPSATTGPAGAC